MKVLVVVPIEASVPGSDLGGVITNVEQIMVGLKEAGHKATFVRLRDAPVLGRNNVPDRAAYGEDQWVIGPGTGYRMHTVLGWQGPYYTTTVQSSLDAYIKLANDHDIVIWGAMFGFKNKYAEQNAQWVRAFSEVKAKQVVIINDDYFWDRQAWSSVVDPYIAGWASVHDCGFDLSVGLDKPRAVIFNAHDMNYPNERKSFDDRTNEVLMVQNWKSWKRGDRLVRAVPHMKSRVTLAGNGIELRYMRAEEKCKPTYFVTKRNDPDAVPPMQGKRIWENAEGRKTFKYVGALTEQQRDERMANVKFLVDLSDRDNSGMFNRVFHEAARQGCVTIAYEKFMSGVAGDNRLWQPWEHYIPAPYNAQPLVLATFIDKLMKMDANKYEEIVQNVLDKLPLFDRKTVASQLVSFAMGKKPKGVHRYDAGGKPDANLLEMGRLNYAKSFGELP